MSRYTHELASSNSSTTFRSKQTIVREILTVQHRRWPGSHCYNSYNMTGRTTLNIHTITKGKCHPKTCQESPEAQKRYNSTFSLTSEPEKGRWLAPRLGRLTPVKTRYQMHRRLGGPRAGLNGCRKPLPETGFDPRTIQTAASGYTD